MEKVVQAINVTKAFGGLKALKDISLEAAKGQIVGIIGPNGAGKTTLFNCLTGLYFPSEGEIIFRSKSIVSKPSGRKMQLIERCALIFMILSILWTPLFWAYYLPQTIYKVELTMLALFILSMRWLVFRGLNQWQIWAWSMMLVFLPADLYLAGLWIHSPSGVGQVPGTSVSLAYFALPWCAAVIPFHIYLLYQLMILEVRQLYGFRVGPDAINRYGIARTFQNIRLFLNLSVLDNVKIGAHGRMKAGIWSALFQPASKRKEEIMIEQESLDFLNFVGLDRYAFDLAGSLPYGEQRRLEISRALASNPHLILLDEPAAGMNPQESAQLIQLIQRIRDKGITILMIEHDMKVMMNLADVIYVLDHGELIAQGTPDEIRANAQVIEAY